MITRDLLLEHNVNLAIEKFKDDMETSSVGEQLQEEIWLNKDIFGEIMFNIVIETLGEEVFD